MRKTLFFMAKVAITAALLYFAVGRVNFGAIEDRLSRLDPVWIAAALAAVAVQTLFLAMRWQAIAIACGAVLPLRLSYGFTMISIFFGQVLPTTVGGDAVRVWLLARRDSNWSAATYSVLIDRFIGVLGLAVMVIVCLPWSLALIENPIGRSALLLIGFGSIAAALAFLLLGNIQSAFLQRFWALRHLTKLAVTVRKLLASTTGLWTMALSLLSHVLTSTIAWCAAHAAATPFEFAHSLLLIPPIMLISTVPISIAGWGVRETALIVAFGYAGLQAGDALVVSILFGAAMFAFGLAGGGLWLLSGAELKIPAAPPEEQSASPQP
jgi:glycosyltransferase 2 family protein